MTFIDMWIIIFLISDEQPDDSSDSEAAGPPNQVPHIAVPQVQVPQVQVPPVYNVHHMQVQQNGKFHRSYWIKWILKFVVCDNCSNI